MSARVRPSVIGIRSDSVTTGSIGRAASTRRSNSSIPFPVFAETKTGPESPARATLDSRVSFKQRRQEIGFVEHAQDWAAVDAELAQNFVDFFVEFVVMRIRNVADVKDHRGFLNFFERGAKRSEQSLWQIANESDRVGDEYASIGRKADGANRRVERREHARRDEHFGVAERVEERRFAGVGVADQRDGAERNCITRVAAQRALLADFVDRFLNFGDAIANAATVGLEFLFARATDADAACAATGAAGAAATAFAAETRHRSALSA